MTLNRLRALMLLSECTGDDIWSLEHCHQRGVPESWLEELADCFESNFQRHDQTIFVDEKMTNQYEGIRDVDLAIRLGEFLGVQIDRLLPTATTRTELVGMIKVEAEEN